jgi:hypothetical protein
VLKSSFSEQRKNLYRLYEKTKSVFLSLIMHKQVV